MTKIFAVQEHDLKRVGKAYVQNLLTDETCLTTVVCRPSKAAQVQEDFQRYVPVETIRMTFSHIKINNLYYYPFIETESN